MSVKVELSELGEAMGRHDYAFLGERGGVTLVFPPREAGDRSLIVDGTVAQVGDGELVVTPVGAVLHRPA